MYLRQLTVMNVRQFTHKTVDFLPGVNLLVGENGAGKSTLLRSVAAVLGAKSGRNNTSTLGDDDISLFSREMRINAIVSHTESTNAAYSYRRSWGERAHRQREDDFPLVLMYGPNESTCSSFVAKRKLRQRSQHEEPFRFNDEEWLYDEMVRRPTLGKNSIRFGSSWEIRRFVSHALSLFSPKLLGFSWVFEPYRCTIKQQAPGPGDLEPALKRLLAKAILRYLDERKRPLRTGEQSKFVIDSSGYPIGKDINQKRIGPIPSFGEIFQLFGKGDVPRADFKNLIAEIHLTPRIRIETPNGPFLLSHMSDGEKRLFSILVDIARQLSLSRHGAAIEKIPAIVLIDEIDVHLHPKWQRQIVPRLEDLFPSCQVIATTHSPFVVQGVKESQVQHLDRTLIGEFTNRGIEEIAAKVMGIEDHEVSPRYLEMLDAAREYFKLLESAMQSKSRGNSAAVTRAKREMDLLSAQYARNPAYQAFLEINKDLSLGGGN